MSQNQQVLSKAQEQLNYATSRCGTLMEQLGRIKSHMKWKNTVKENLVEENSEEEKEDDSRNKDKIKAYKGEPTENNLAEDIVKQIDKRKISNKTVKNEFSDEERELKILSPGSSCFESFVSENSLSITTGSLVSSEEEIEDENVEENQVEVNETVKDKREKKYGILEMEASKENEWETDEEVDEDDDQYETEEEEEVYSRNLEEKQNKNEEEIDVQNKLSYFMGKKSDATGINIESVSERSEETDNSSEYTTTDLENENENVKEINKIETKLKVETKKVDEKIELMGKKSKEVLPKITSSLKVNLFTEELATDFIPLTQDLDKDIEIIEINANDFNQNNNENNSKENELEKIKSNIDNLTEKGDGNKNKCALQIEQKDTGNKTTTKFNNKIKKNEKASFMKKEEEKRLNKNQSLNQERVRLKLENVAINKKQKEQKKTVMLENEETKNKKKNETLVTSTKVDSKKQIRKKILGKKDKSELNNKQNVKILETKPTVNVSNNENQTKTLNVFERLSLNTKKGQNFGNKQTKNIKSTGQIKKNNNLKNINHIEKLSNGGCNMKIRENKLEQSNVSESEEVISRSLFESIQKTIRQNLDLKYDNMQSVNENSKNGNLITGKSNQVIISKNSEENRESKAINTTTESTADPKQLKVHDSKTYNKSTNIANGIKKNEKIELDNDVDNKKFMRSEAVSENEIYQNCINMNNNVLFENESVKTFTLLRTQQNPRRPESRKKSSFKYKNWEENSEFNSLKIIATPNKTNVPQIVSAANINYNTHNTKIANSLGFNTIPFIVGKSTSKSFHIGLNIQQTLSLINLSPSVPAIKLGIENKHAGDLEKDSSISSVTTTTYKPKVCPACTGAQQDTKDEDEELILEDPWHVPQKDAWDQQNIASRKRIRCTCLPANIISFNEVLSQMFQAEGLMPSRPRSSTNVSYDSGQDGGKGYQENKKLIVRPNNATYLTRLLRNIQRIQDKYIVPITKLSLNGFKYNAP